MALRRNENWPGPLSPRKSSGFSRRKMLKNAPVVFEQDGKVLASSRDIAEIFGKEHRNVTRDIESLIEQMSQDRVLNFEQTVFDAQTRVEARRSNPRATSWTVTASRCWPWGSMARSPSWKLKYIEAFNKMEASCVTWPQKLPRQPFKAASPAPGLHRGRGFAGRSG